MQTLVSSWISQGLKDLIYAAVFVGVTMGWPLIKHAASVLLTKLPVNYRSIAEQIASDAVVYVEHFVIVGGGSAKFNAAVQRVIASIQHHGISISLTEIEGIVQKAYENALKAGEVTSSGNVQTPVEPVIAAPPSLATDVFQSNA